MDTQQTNSRIVSAYRERTRGSAALAAEAAGLFPSGITHDSRHLDPYGIYVERALGPHKWDVDGNRYVDFFGGHGALLLGHNHPMVHEAAARAMGAGTHFGANHAGEVGWARAVRRLIPSAERVRFTSSGTEATLMAVRLARAHTGRGTLLRLRGHFHGWHDHMTAGYSSHFDGSPTPGVLAGVAEKSLLIDPNDEAGLRAALEGNADIAAVILEPTGSSFGQVPIRPEFLHTLRRLSEAHGVLLIFDEVVTGFRVARGGAQSAFGIRPDLTSLAKILAGGLPGGAVVGRRDILDLLDFRASAAAQREKIQHQGTFNGNPVSAAAGTVALSVIADTDASERANATAAALREALNEVIAAEGVKWAVYGTSSGFHLFMNPRRRPIVPGRFDPHSADFAEMKDQPGKIARKLRLALLVNGVDVNGRLGGLLSCTHEASDLADTVAGFREALRMVRQEEEIG